MSVESVGILVFVGLMILKVGTADPVCWAGSRYVPLQPDRALWIAHWMISLSPTSSLWTLLPDLITPTAAPSQSFLSVFCECMCDRALMSNTVQLGRAPKWRRNFDPVLTWYNQLFSFPSVFSFSFPLPSIFLSLSSHTIKSSVLVRGRENMLENQVHTAS